MYKCSFSQRKIDYLRHVISEQGVSIDPLKIKAIQAWPSPENVKQIKSFLGLTGYHRKFVRHFVIICRPLTDLLKKQGVFIWTEHHERAFLTLKQALVEAPVLLSLIFPNSSNWRLMLVS
jgi:hypothetical protein